MINNVVLLGRLTAAPELKATTNGVSVLPFTLAVARRFQSKGGEKQTDFIDCVAWRETAEFIKRYFGKGDPIAVTGEIQTRKYDDKDGNPRKAVEVVVTQASFTGGKNSGNNPEVTANTNDSEAGDDFILLPIDDDLPF